MTNVRESLFAALRRRLHLIVRYRREVDNWRNPTETDHHVRYLDVLCVTFRWERQTHPDERWHFLVSQRSSDGMGFYRTSGWGRKGGSELYHASARLDWSLGLSMRPNYKIVYAPSWVHCMARLTGRHPIEVAQRMVEQGQEIVDAPKEPVA